MSCTSNQYEREKVHMRQRDKMYVFVILTCDGCRGCTIIVSGYIAAAATTHTAATTGKTLSIIPRLQNRQTKSLQQFSA